jgi:hypothetical protein
MQLTEAIADYEGTEIEGEKPVLDRSHIDEATALRILQGNTICTWGQCYYSTKKNA